MLSGTRANIAVKVFGDDLGTLRRLGERVREAMAGVPGVADLSLEQQMDVPFVRFVLEPPAIARYGLRPGDVAEAIETSFAGATVGRVFDRGTAFDLMVKFDPSSSADFDRIADLPIDTPTGAMVPVRLLADVRREQGPNMVLRENVQRRIVVSCNVAGRDLGSVVEDISTAVRKSVPMPAGYRVEYGGQFESEQSASQRLLALGVLVIAGLFMLLVLAFGRARDALLIMVNLPLALIGGVAGVFLAGRRAQRGDADRVHHPVRHRHAQRHHARVAHPAPDGGGRRHQLPRGGERGARGAAGADPDDGDGGGAGADSAGARRRPVGQRDPDADGHRHPVRAGHVDAAEHVRRAGAVSALRPICRVSTRFGGDHESLEDYS